MRIYSPGEKVAVLMDRKNWVRAIVVKKDDMPSGISARYIVKLCEGGEENLSVQERIMAPASAYVCNQCGNEVDEDALDAMCSERIEMRGTTGMVHLSYDVICSKHPIPTHMTRMPALKKHR